MSDLFVGVGSDFFQNSLLILPENINLIEAELLSTDSYIKYPNVDSAYKDLNFNLKTDNSNLIIKLLPTLLSVFGALLGLLLYNNKHYLKLLTPYLFNKPYSILNNIDNTNIKSTQTSPLLANYTTTHIKAPSTLLPEGTIGTHPIVDIYSVTKNNNLLKKLYSFFNGKYYFDIIYNNFIIAKGMNFSYKISKEIDRGIVELLGPNGLSNVFYNLAKNIARLDSGIITTYALYITISLLVFIFLFFVTPSYPALNAELLGSEILSQDKVEYIINSYNINIENIDKNIFNAGNISNSHLSDIKEKGFMNALKFQNSIEVFKFIIILIFCLFLLPNLNKNKQIN
jgi:NADH-ubiquinone oxidoreductase chain 5